MELLLCSHRAPTCLSAGCPSLPTPPTFCPHPGTALQPQPTHSFLPGAVPPHRARETDPRLRAAGAEELLTSPRLHSSCPGPRPPRQQASGASVRPCLSAQPTEPMLPVSGFVFLYLVSFRVQSWGPTLRKGHTPLWRLLCASCLQTPRAPHTSPTAPYQNPGGTQGGEGLTVCERDSDRRQVEAQEADTRVVFNPACTLESYLELKKDLFPASR